MLRHGFLRPLKGTAMFWVLSSPVCRGGAHARHRDDVTARGGTKASVPGSAEGVDPSCGLEFVRERCRLCVVHTGRRGDMQLARSGGTEAGWERVVNVEDQRVIWVLK
ncbi:hypothetical protein C8F04DRAFT_11871 [Mycena alexandri]|uniref:Uncharacterized protein n=1 Tax=Mycena alexandri TaxID=1745969 RepID=A0AAD6TJJ7_9AGAR|nr:hypothetical protein C8F04DRAFT_11871 [Mycena alexandri]